MEAGPGAYQHAARLTVVPAPDVKAQGTGAPVYAATEVSVFDDEQEVGKTFKAEGGLDAFVADVRAAYAPPAPKPPQTPVERAKKWADEVSVWTVVSIGLLVVGGAAVVLAVTAFAVRSLLARKRRPAGRRTRGDADRAPADED